MATLSSPRRAPRVFRHGICLAMSLSFIFVMPLARRGGAAAGSMVSCGIAQERLAGKDDDARRGSTPRTYARPHAASVCARLAPGTYRISLAASARRPNSRRCSPSTTMRPRSVTPSATTPRRWRRSKRARISPRRFVTPEDEGGRAGHGREPGQARDLAHEAALDAVALAGEHEPHQLEDLSRARRRVGDARQLPGPRLQHLAAAVSQRPPPAAPSRPRPRSGGRPSARRRPPARPRPAGGPRTGRGRSGRRAARAGARAALAQDRAEEEVRDGQRAVEVQGALWPRARPPRSRSRARSSVARR